MPDPCVDSKVSLPGSRQAGFLYWEFFLPDYHKVGGLFTFFAEKKRITERSRRVMHDNASSECTQLGWEGPARGAYDLFQ